MTTHPHATGEQIAGQDCAPAESALIDVEQLAALCRCSTRHIYRLADAGRAPRPLKIGALCRWRRDEVLQWISDGCKSVRNAKGGWAMIARRHDATTTPEANNLFDGLEPIKNADAATPANH